MSPLHINITVLINYDKLRLALVRIIGITIVFVTISGNLFLLFFIPLEFCSSFAFLVNAPCLALIHSTITYTLAAGF